MVGPGRLVDAVLVVRDLFDRYPGLRHSTIAPHPELSPSLLGKPQIAVRIQGARDPADGSSWSVLRIATEEARRAFGLETYPIAVKSLTEERIRRHLGMAVLDEQEVAISAERIMRSILEFRRTRARISYVDTLNACWRRFVLCKELAHIILGERGDMYASNVTEQLNMAMQIGGLIDAATELNREMFAWCMAIEIMLPWHTRTNLLHKRGGSEDHLDLARAYWIPRAIIDLYFETGYGQLSMELNVDAVG